MALCLQVELEEEAFIPILSCFKQEIQGLERLK